jgi:hypothetical protein
MTGQPECAFMMGRILQSLKDGRNAEENYNRARYRAAASGELQSTSSLVDGEKGDKDGGSLSLLNVDVIAEVRKLNKSVKQNGGVPTPDAMKNKFWDGAQRDIQDAIKDGRLQTIRINAEGGSSQVRQELDIKYLLTSLTLHYMALPCQLDVDPPSIRI